MERNAELNAEKFVEALEALDAEAATVKALELAPLIDHARGWLQLEIARKRHHLGAVTSDKGDVEVARQKRREAKDDMDRLVAELRKGTPDPAEALRVRDALDVAKAAHAYWAGLIEGKGAAAARLLDGAANRALLNECDDARRLLMACVDAYNDTRFGAARLGTLVEGKRCRELALAVIGFEGAVAAYEPSKQGLPAVDHGGITPAHLAFEAEGRTRAGLRAALITLFVQEWTRASEREKPIDPLAGPDPHGIKAMIRRGEIGAPLVKRIDGDGREHQRTGGRNARAARP